ncbi:hypothetical protein [Streptomyces sp. NPDC047071]|uniref:hypothetical protein n=1 Tax=Streptomyces sp. NPDC047071 TaxID=3154808 RepID=UPI0034528D33
MSDFLHPEPAAPITVHGDINGSFNKNVNAPMANGRNSSQRNVHGYAPERFAAFAREVLAAAQEITLPDDRRAQLVQDAQSLVEEAEGSEPGHGRLRELAGRVRGALEQSLMQNAADAVATELLGQAQSLF